ncbi:MAG TPA: ATP-binding protein [Actinomycetota bacterium]|nr:ATP-binding protein [Actinomycetota bacterium]
MGVSVVEVERKLPVSPDAAREARRVLGPLAEHLERQEFDDLRLLVTELVTNSLRHAGLGPGDAIELAVRVDAASVRVEVRDSGKGFDLPPVRGNHSDAEGWGLHLLGRIADRWGVEREPATCVWFEIDIEIQ